MQSVCKIHCQSRARCAMAASRATTPPIYKDGACFNDAFGPLFFHIKKAVKLSLQLLSENKNLHMLEIFCK